MDNTFAQFGIPDAWLFDGILLADGAWGTEMLKRGLPQGDGPEGWNLSKPDAVREVPAAYADAGSRVVLTNTFGGSSLQLERHGLADKAVEINRIGAEITAEAVGDRAITAGDIGPSGKMVLMGEVTEEQLLEAFTEQAEALKAGGAKWLVIETMTDLQEMLAAVKAAASTGLPVVASMTYETQKRETGITYATIMGNKPQDCVPACIEAGASIIGANCGTGIDNYIALAAELAGLTDAPVWIKANAGLPELIDGQVTYTMTAETYASHVPALLDAGTTAVGGCCGTGPEYIRAIRKVLESR